MSRLVLIAVGLLTALPAHAAAPVKPFPIATDGTTNIADCAKAPVGVRNECISKSRPVMGKQLYAQEAALKVAAMKKAKLDAAKAAKMAKVGKGVKADVAKVVAVAKPIAIAVAKPVSKGFTMDKNGTTNVADCAKANPAFHNECLSRARPLAGAELTKFISARARVSAPTVTASVPAGKAAPVIKGFKIAKDGTTNITDCANAVAEFRNECISRARPVPGSALYASMKPKS